MRFRRFKRERGATMVEFTLVVVFFLFFVIIASQMLYMCYTWLSLQFVASRMLRGSVIGPPAAASPTETIDTRVAAHTLNMEDQIIETGRAFLLTLQASNIHICPLSSSGGNIQCATDNAGQPGDLVTVYIRYPFNMIFFNFPIYTLDALAVGRNEFFD